MIVPINVIEFVNGEPVINLAPDAANDDWIRAARLKEQGKEEELKKLENTPMYKEVPDEEEEEQ